MSVDEGKKVIEQLKAEGHSEEEILGSFYKMFQDDKLTLDELDGFVNLMGYHLTDEFKAMSPEDQKTKGYEETEEPAEGVSEEEVEEGKEEGKEAKEPEGEAEDKGEEPEAEEAKPEDKGDESESEDDEEKKAMKLFGLENY